MSAIGDCCHICPPVTPPVNIPGSAGTPGENGSNGVNAFSTIASFQGVGFTVPAVGSSATIYLVDTGEWMALNQPVYIQGAGLYIVTATASVNVNGTSVQLKNTGVPGNASPGAVISSGLTISPSGLRGTNAYTTTTATFVTPYPTGGGSPTQATITVVDASWMIPGEPVFVQGGGFFIVVSVNTVSNTAVLSNPGFANTVANATIPVGFAVGPSGTQGSLPLPTPTSSYINAQSIALSTSAVNPGSISLTLAAAGTWIIFARVSGYYSATGGSGTVVAANVFSQLQSQAAGSGPLSPVPNSSATLGLPEVQNSSNQTGGWAETLGYIIYTTATVGDKIFLYSQLNNVQGALSSATVSEASMLAFCANLTT